MSRSQHRRSRHLPAEASSLKHKSLRKKSKSSRTTAQPQGSASDSDATAAAIPAPRQRTVENSRLPSETIVTPDSAEVQADDATDEFAAFFRGEEQPKVLVTTSIRPGPVTSDFATELATVFPSGNFLPRPPHYQTVARIANEALGQGYTHLIVVLEQDRPSGNRKPVPDSLALVKLPHGPTAFFKLSSLTLAAQIHGHGRCTAHAPELVLNNFSSRIGHAIGRFFVSMFPAVPQFHGRQVVTFHNQRDFVFVRRHRYIFDGEGQRVSLQELGPRFTLKLEALQRGLMDRRGGDFDLSFKATSDAARTKKSVL